SLGVEQFCDYTLADFVLDVSNEFFSRISLLRRLTKNGRRILGPNVAALAIGRGGVMRAEEDLQQIFETDDVRVECDTNDFDVSGRLATHLLVAGVIDVAATIAWRHFSDAAQWQENGLGAPKAPAAKNRGFSNGISFICLSTPRRPA